MKRYLYLLLLIITLCIPSSLWGWGAQSAMMGGTVAGGAITYACAAGCASVADADVFCEDFDGTADPGAKYRCTSWTDEVSTGEAIDRVASDTSCTDRGDYAVRYTVAGGAGNYADSNRAMTNTVTYTQFYFKINSSSLVSGDTAGDLLGIYNAAWAPLSTVRLYHNGTNLVLRTYVYNVAVVDGTTAISVGTWYRLRHYYSGDAGDAQTYVATWQGADVSQANITTGTTELIPAYIASGMYEPAKAMTITVDNIKVDSSAFPAICTGDAS